MPQPTSLYLAPLDPASAPDMHTVMQVLEELEIIGAALDGSSYRAGPGFSRHVVFAGCSPHLVMQPPADGSLAFCHVALHGPFAEPRLVTGPNTVRPRCPACRAPFAGWRAQLQAWKQGLDRARCADCGRRMAPAALDWRGHAIAGRVLVELRNVFPGEASPSDRLLQTLAERSGQDWQYAWAARLDA